MRFDWVRYGVLFIVFCNVMLLFGCGTIQQRDVAIDLPETTSKQLPNQKKVKQNLYSQHKNWKATPYKLGGSTKRGVDCSGFVRVTFKSRFGIKLPRNTYKQSKIGSRISQKKLKAGDLVFFKTKPGVRHVGIYLENRRFLHASTSRGVMISSLDNVYWSRKYWMAVRV